ncbi:KAR9-domain-containing protein [Bimuria novae-zelandiae CBS 107.79]|uniref:KAR9-domain-containing protein n=1 Tax=Bimuria novae-zelandiae CBS 107.79 TaxID=1447943 RepID=A0A6A5VT25_9PLEO|nr:KAR9-domain-containing protein [Bimuria novae-zelandiae CBS 107.79]
MNPSVTPPGPTPPSAPSSTTVDEVAGPSTPTPTPPFPRLSPARSTAASPKRPEPALDSTTKLARNVSPGLLARMKFLNQHQAPEPARGASPAQIGRIAQHKIRELDEFHRDRRNVSIERRGTAWSGTSSQVGTPLIPQLTGESVPALAMDTSPPSSFESNRSSFVSTSDRVLPSDSEAGDLNEDTQKYRLPDITKTKSLSQAVTETGASSDTELDRPPTPPPKDTPPAAEASVLDSDNDGINVEAYFHQRHFSRTDSIYTLSRASFTNQIQQLTSIKLPPPNSLTSEIRALPSSTAAGRALHSAANSIKQWMTKAAEVLSGLDAEDDVEWAAAAGREGLEEVDAAIGKFEGLVNVYITAIEDLQARDDIASLPGRDLTTLVVQMEEVVSNWSKIKKTLKGIKSQVEIAMEWEELWNSVLGEIGMEIENLSRLVFEMEERRHRAISDSVAESAEKFDIADLETIVEETPRLQAREQARIQSNRFSMPPTLSVLSPISPIPQIEQENSRLLALFAKLQPLRASLDFLPMRLQHFQMRARTLFPSACDELTRRKEQLEKLEKKLEADADALREELGEDKWVHSFRQAGSKAIAMYDSLMKSIQRLRQVIEEGDEEKLGSRMSTYKDKREHYPPSMKRVLELIDIEMKHRSTVNGEILRIQQDVRQKVSDLEIELKEMDMILEEVTATRKLRDSVSTVLSARTEASLTGSAIGTPNSSPASSVIMSRKSSEYGAITPVGKKSRQPSSSSTKSTLSANRRLSSLPLATGRKSISASRLEALATPAHLPRSMSSTPTGQLRSATPSSEKPRWNISTNMRDTIIGHNHKPLSLTDPSLHRKGPITPLRTLRSVSSHSAIPVRSPLSQSSALSPPPSSRPASTIPAQQSITRRPLASPMQSPSTPARGKSALATTPNSGLSYRTPTSGRRVTIAEEESDSTATEESPMARRIARPASVLNSRRTSMLPTPKQRTSSGTNIPQIATPGGRTHSRMGSTDDGRRSKLGLNAGRTSQAGMSSGRKSSLEERPRWR